MGIRWRCNLGVASSGLILPTACSTSSNTVLYGTRRSPQTAYTGPFVTCNFTGMLACGIHRQSILLNLSVEVRSSDPTSIGLPDSTMWPPDRPGKMPA